MAKEEKTIYVYDDFTGDEPFLLGELNVGVIKGSESYTFEYNKDWLAHNELQFTLDPELLPFEGRQFPSGKKVFGLFADASPDRWGRMLMTSGN